MERIVGTISKEVEAFVAKQSNVSKVDYDYICDQLVVKTKVPSRRISTVLKHQLTATYANRTLNTFAVIDEIASLETTSYSMTKKPSQFKRHPLKGFWHSHFFDASFMEQNIVNHWGGQTKLDKKVAIEMERPLSPGETIEERAGRLAHELVSQGWEDRAQEQKVTGEWIIYQVHDEKKYYLWLTTHDHDDQQIYDSMKYCCKDEFPFLFSEE